MLHCRKMELRGVSHGHLTMKGMTPMTAVTHDLRIAAATAKAAAPVKSLWERVLDRLYEARMRQVEREILTHRHFIPEDVLARIRKRIARRD